MLPCRRRGRTGVGGGVAQGCGNGCGSYQCGELGLMGEPFGVVTDSEQELSGADRADAIDPQQRQGMDGYDVGQRSIGVVGFSV